MKLDMHTHIVDVHFVPQACAMLQVVMTAASLSMQLMVDLQLPLTLQLTVRV